MKNNDKGFSLVELIIVVAIIAILVGVIAPQFMQYVAKARRTKDAHNAKEIAQVMDMLYVTEDASTWHPGYGPGGGHMNAFMWHKGDSPVGDTIYDKMLQHFGSAPVPSINENYYWCIFYSTGDSGHTEVKSIYIVEGPGSTTGYMVYPDEQLYVEKGEKVTIP